MKNIRKSLLEKIKLKYSDFSYAMKLGIIAGRGDWQEVINILTNINERSGEPECGYSMLTKAYYYLNNYKMALLYGYKAYEIDKSNFDVIKILTEINFKLNKHDKAKEFANIALMYQPKSDSFFLNSFLLFVFKLLFFIPRFRKKHKKLVNNLKNNKIHKNQWLMWASDYTSGTNQILASNKQITNWSDKFPDLGGEWTHWWLEGENYCLAVVSSDNLSEGIEIIKKNWKRFFSIYAYRAKIDSNGNPLLQSKRRVEISNHQNDFKLYT
jgi:tetratricopeptide (TPR) repeat protein